MANASTKACPNLSQYQQLLSGTLPEAEKEPLLAHLERCDACAQQLKSLPEPDTLVGMLRQADTLSEEASRKAIAGLVERLSKMRPQSAEATKVPTTGTPNPDATIDQEPIEAARKSTYDFLAPALAPDEIGRLGPYRVLEVLGSGGMGVVFRAEDPQLARLVALKAMLPGFIASDNARQRFLREARAAAGIKHDNIVSIYQVGEDRGILYLAMEFLEGEPLDKRLDREGKLPVAEVLRIGKQIAAGLAAAHKRNMIHRDIKPANIWLEAETNRVKILDFGLARSSGENAQLTQQGAIVGTPAYMSPEQGKGKSVDHRCDLFSLGCVLYRLATGKPAFHGTDVVSTLLAVATQTPRPPQALEPRLPRALSDLIVQLLAKDAAQRPESARGVAERLEAIAQEQARVVPKKPRRWWPVVAGAAACLALLFAGIVFYMQTSDGVVRIEIDDPKIELKIQGHEAVIKNADKQPITLKPGKHGLTITRGDFVFNTNSFEMPGRGGKTALKITWHQEKKLAIVQDDRPLAVNVVREPAPDDPERLAAEYVLALRGTVKVDALSNPFLYIVAELPRRPFQVSLIELRNLQITDSGLANLKPCKNLRRLFLFGTPITDVGLAQLRHFTTLEHLHLGSTRVTDAGLANFKNCKGLTELDIVYTAIGDDGLAHLKDFGSLASLNLIGTRISDAGLDHLKHCASLRVVHLQKTKVTEAGARKLAAALPRCRIEWNGPVIEPSTMYSNALGMDFALVPKGRSWLGGGAGKPGNKEVEFKDDFYLGVYEVTQGQWERLMGNNPSLLTRTGAGAPAIKEVSDEELKHFPVESISWHDVQRFIAELNKRDQQSGWTYRLPTEAEWEYACRGGPMTDKAESAFDFYFATPTNLLSPKENSYGGSRGLGLRRATKVGSFAPNKLGLHDMHGNVVEWCDDEIPADPKDANGTPRRVIRGGHFWGDADDCRAAYRFVHDASVCTPSMGMRVARVRAAAADSAGFSAAQRQSLEWVLSVGGSLRLVIDGKHVEIRRPDRLPASPFRVYWIYLRGLLQVDGKALEQLAASPPTGQIYLDNSAISNEGLAKLLASPGFSKLIILNLNNTAISDAGLESLARLTNLEVVRLHRTKVTEAGIKKLAAALPSCRIEWDNGPPAQTTDRPPAFTNSLGMEFARIPKGKAWLGGGGGIVGDKEVQFKEDFYLGIYEVTQEQWQTVTGTNPSHFSRKGARKDTVNLVPDAQLRRFPVDSVSWPDTQMFLKLLNAQAKDAGWEYRLPTEAEWEYACRGGPMSDKSESAFDYYLDKPGNLLAERQANFTGVLGRPAPVGSYHPNRLGLFDMHGNVSEWCNDPRGVFRGGAWNSGSWTCSASHKAKQNPGNRNNLMGLRVARVSTPRSVPIVIGEFNELQAKTYQLDWAKFLERKVVETNNVGMKMTLVPPGKFQMGAPEKMKAGAVEFKTSAHERPMHPVEMSVPFVMASTEVTQEQFQKLMGRNASEFAPTGTKAKDVAGVKTATLPAEMVTWFDALEFCNKLSEKEGRKPYYELKFEARNADGGIRAADVKELGGEGYRLPTEAEWEWACRAGTSAAFSFDFDYGTLPQFGWFGYDAKRPNDVGSRKPNPFGLHDMHGNVFEWCSDWYGPYDAKPARDPRGPASGTERVMRGGCWNHLPEFCRSASRSKLAPGGRTNNVGFRVVRSTRIAAVAIADPDRRAAEFLLSLPREHAIAVQVNDVDPWITQSRDLPVESFRLTSVWAEWVSRLDDDGLANFQGCKHIKILRLWGTQTSALGLAAFKDCQELQELSLSGDNFDDAAIGLFKDRKQLTTFHVITKNVTDAGVANFQWTKDLTTLTLSHTKVTDAGLANFKNNKALKVLNLGAAKVTNAGLAPFANCKDLEALELFWTDVGDAGLAHFKACKKLARVNLDRLSRATDKGIGIFKDADDLRILNLGGTRISNDGLAQVKSWPKLKILFLPNTQVTDPGLVHLKTCLHLEELDLVKTRVNGSGVAHLKDCPKLVRLTLRETETDDKSVPAFGALTKLRWLAVERTRLSAEGAKKLSAALPQCEIVSDHGTFRAGENEIVSRCK